MRGFVRDEIKPVALHPDRLEPFAKPLLTEHLAALSNMGVRALSMSEANNGAGADTHTACLVIEEIAQADPDIAVVLAHTAVLARVVFDESVSMVQRQRYLPAFIGEATFHLAYAGLSPEAGLAVDYHRERSAVPASSLTTGKNGDGSWVINGEAAGVANAGVAQLFVVNAGAFTLLVPRTTPGLTVHERGSERGGASLRWGHGAPGRVVFRDCTVAAGEALAGAADIQARYAQRVAPLLAAANIGVGQAAFDAAIDYTRLRRQGGKQIIEHQAIGTLLAEIAIKLEAARGLVWKAAWTQDHPQALADRSVSPLPLHHMARAYTSELMVEVTERAAECFGAMGVMRDMPLQKYVDDALRFKHDEVSVGAAKLLVAEAIAGFQRSAVHPANG